MKKIWEKLKNEHYDILWEISELENELKEINKNCYVYNNLLKRKNKLLIEERILKLVIK